MIRMTDMEEESQKYEIEIDLVLRLEPRLVERIQRLVDTPELSFPTIESLIRTALYSFVGYKERLVQRLQGGQS